MDKPPTCDISNPPSGPFHINSDTQGVDFGPYSSKLLLSIKTNWYSLIPDEAISPNGKQGCGVLDFTIRRDGSLQESPRFVFTSGDTLLDRAAYGAITLTPPFSPLPAEFKGESLTYRFTFLYNPPVPAAQRDLQVPAHPTSLAAERNATSNATNSSFKQLGADEISPGRLLLKVDLKYPKEARKRKLEGQVILQATIERDGSVGNVSVVGGDVILAESAVNAVREWRFEPYMQNGLPIRVLQNLSFTFARDEKIGELSPSLPAPAAAAKSAILDSGSQKSSSAETGFRLGGGVTCSESDICSSSCL